MHTLVALLRGINVGGKNPLPMKDLVTILEAIGARNVKTYGQSGNAVFESGEDDLAQLSEKLTAAIKRQRDFEPRALIFRLAEIEKAIDTETATVKDNASPQLRSLRARIFKLRNRLRSILESYFRQKDSRKILQDQIITERNGRSVLPVRSECRGELV